MLFLGFLLPALCQIKAQEIIIQPPVFTPFECTDFFSLYTGTVTNFMQESFRTQLLLEVDYTSPSGNSFRLAEGILKGNPSSDFPSGLTVIDNASVETIYPDRQITFFDKDIENLLQQSKCLPPGTYDVCLTLYDITATIGSADFLSQTCYRRDKQMFSPLLLVSPFEGDEVSISLPLFTWTPVSPINPNAMYRIQMVEMLANQTPFEAFRANPVFFERAGLFSNIFQYPVEARTMLPCTEYAWQVTYELQGTFVSQAFQRVPDFLQQSEIWTFHTPCKVEEEEDVEVVLPERIKREYFKAKTHDFNTYRQVGETIRIFVDSPYPLKESTSYSVENDKGEVVDTKCCPLTLDFEENSNSAQIEEGTNLLLLDISKLGLSTDEHYKVIIKGQREDFMFFLIMNQDEN